MGVERMQEIILETTKEITPCLFKYSQRDAIISRMAGSSSACKTVLEYPRESPNSLHALTTAVLCLFRVIMAAHVAPEQVSRPKHGTKGASFVSTKSVIERDPGRNVLVNVCSASVRIVSTSSFDACRTPGLICQMGQHVLFSVATDR